MSIIIKFMWIASHLMLAKFIKLSFLAINKKKSFLEKHFSLLHSTEIKFRKKQTFSSIYNSVPNNFMVSGEEEEEEEEEEDSIMAG
jgi:hypothetical protein